ncbi:MAG: sodium:calcium antiporter [Candidatus Aenigmatarchaeota archaeon]
MTLLVDILFFAAALILLIKGAGWVTKYASKLVLRWGVSEFAIGATIVAVATSLPEIFVSLVSGTSHLASPGLGTIDIASGTVIGSNIANIGLVLALVILLRPMGADREAIKEEHFMLLISFLLALLLVGGMGLAGGFFLLGLTAVYAIFLVGRTRTYNPLILLRGVYYKLAARESLRDLLLSMLGGVALAVGAVLMVNSVIGISAELAIPKFLIALLAVAIGTSLPELSASLYAAFKGMKGLAVGDIIGSNIINICALGLTATIVPIASNPRMLYLDVPIMLLLAVMLLLFMRTSRGLSRITGLSMLLLYISFVLIQFA